MGKDNALGAISMTQNLVVVVFNPRSFNTFSNPMALTRETWKEKVGGRVLDLRAGAASSRLKPNFWAKNGH